jgi:hypothetical protein
MHSRANDTEPDLEAVAVSIECISSNSSTVKAAIWMELEPSGVNKHVARIFR